MILSNDQKMLIGLIGLIVLASGCTDTNQGTSVSYTPNTGITIQEFSAFPSEVQQGQSVNLRMVMENTGERTAEQVSVTLFNTPFNEDETTWQASGDSRTPEILSGQTLQPGDAEAGVPASPFQVSEQLTSPTDIEGRIPYDIMAEISYRYDTIGTSEIVLMGQERFRNSDVTRSQPSMDNTAGPISISIRTSSPIVFYGENNQEQAASQACLIVRNNGDGVPVLKGELADGDSETRNAVELNLDTAASVGVTSTQSDEDSSEVDVQLVGNKGVHCYEFTNLADYSPSEQLTLPLTAEADYFYEKETQTSVTVDGGN